jgi:hypothetical protein
MEEIGTSGSDQTMPGECAKRWKEGRHDETRRRFRKRKPQEEDFGKKVHLRRRKISEGNHKNKKKKRPV